MWLSVLLLALGIALLVLGAGLLVEAGSSLARRMGLSPLWIGLTIVAVGTSAPEWVVGTVASLEQRGELAAASAVGSNILNVLIVLGATAAIHPVPVAKRTVQRDLVMVVAVSLLAWALSANGTIGRLEGVLLLAMLVPYFWFAYRQEKGGAHLFDEAPTHLDRTPLALQILAAIAGIALLVWGGDVVVTHATAIAEAAGISDRILGLTIVALGTSLPEMATSLVAAARGKTDIAVGNLVGSNILNVLFVLGTAATIGAIAVPQTMIRVDMAIMCAAAVLLLRFGATRGVVSRLEGGLLLGSYGAYFALILLQP